MTDVLHRRLADQPVVTEPSNELSLRGLLAAADSDADLSITWVQLDGHHRRLRTDASTRLYLVLTGSGVLTLDAEPIEIAAGDLVVVPRATPYHLDGTLTYLVMNQPGFRDGDDIYLESPPTDVAQADADAGDPGGG